MAPPTCSADSSAQHSERNRVDRSESEAIAMPDASSMIRTVPGANVGPDGARPDDDGTSR